MFVGEYIVKLDAKGRIAFPSGLKKQIPAEDLEKPFVVKKDIYEPCLILYPEQEWDTHMSIMKRKLNPFNRVHARIIRDYHRDSARLPFDGSFRLLIPKKLLDDVNIDKEMVLAGQEGKIEIWSKEEYDKQRMEQEVFAKNIEEILGNDTNFYE
ncbi:MAG: cell division/cell wall cluster transcriptional repressor MraZ [Bacteroidales bacterium]|nr:cell division/cell wall cluster transcriptional repressor MraZ [Bacteroidales bacterium]HNY43459.1 cell division/cell wall cluster transcriptional repressor MraZ [Bacteroidales bacterium]